ncbi:HAMP domain-containing sensor histidine kinase [Sphingomonas sp. KR1UV-12]|uniref:histidine kinase n=1 Tax=Sphingomonas aurea TaxID=3063994 RepID=A0ABT9EGL7_9SPHN|nr:HAMP domain-containing sensor histidine kinase [Sphingomonas sp. KR1UV-12]MDP1026114.1 HAMP domain-containing sensor histidine kinase [Sphingomonas sp. KR1UV-12]
MNVPDATTGGAVAHAVIGVDGALLSADPAIAMLNSRAGGVLGSRLAIPQLAAAAWLARRLGIVVCRRVTVADDDSDVELWVRAQPEGERIRIAASGWIERPAWRPTCDPLPLLNDGGLSWETDATLRLTFVSPGTARLQGFDPLTLLGRPLTILFGFDEGAGGAMPILDALARRRPFREQPALLRPTGQPVILSASIRPDAQGEFGGLTGSASFVETVDRQDPLSSVFTTGLDKALRAPLLRIVAHADAIGAATDGPVAADYVDYAADIASAGRHLMALVDDLVDLQAIERPDFTPAAVPIDLAEGARRAAALLSVRADHAGVTILKPAADERAPAIGDARRVLQILVNLIGNAVRYTPNGGAVALDVGLSGPTARITVTDHGKGIAPQDQERVFGKFERVDPNEVGGNGLGLFIARRLARAMGGDLTLASAPGEGARFTLTLPTGTLPSA